MKIGAYLAIAFGMGALSGCGEPGVIDYAKRANIEGCPNQSIGRIVNAYFDKSTWTAYETDLPAEIRMTATGDISYAGSLVSAELEFIYDQELERARLSAVRFDGVEQPGPIAAALVADMCAEAGS